MSGLSKKHYEAIAKIFKKNHVELSNADIDFIVCRDFADYFEKDNPLFQRYKFLVACGLECAHAPYSDIGMCSICGMGMR